MRLTRVGLRHTAYTAYTALLMVSVDARHVDDVLTCGHPCAHGRYVPLAAPQRVLQTINLVSTP